MTKYLFELEVQGRLTPEEIAFVGEGMQSEASSVLADERNGDSGPVGVRFASEAGK